MPERWPELRIPDDLSRLAFVVGNGERLWRGEQAVEVADWLAGQGFGILGGEIYARHDVGWGTFVRDWLTEPMRQPNEPWDGYVTRARQQALNYVMSNRRPPISADADADHLYFLAFIGEDAYPDDPIQSADTA
jgi:hypothetical protein